jgi:hypothetical protein
MDVAKTAIMSQLGTRLYGLGTGDAIEGLQLMTDAGTYSTTYGGLSRSTYGAYINGQVTPASAGVVSFQSLAAQIDLCSTASESSDATNLILTTKPSGDSLKLSLKPRTVATMTLLVATSVFLHTPQWVAAVRPDQLPVGSVGFDSYYFRGIPVVKDDKCPTGLIYTLMKTTSSTFHCRLSA